MTAGAVAERPGQVDRLSPEGVRRVAVLRAVRDLAPADPDRPPMVTKSTRNRLMIYISLDDLATLVSGAA
jgi:hypothetical protein